MPRKRSFGRQHLKTEVTYRQFDALKARVTALEHDLKATHTLLGITRLAPSPRPRRGGRTGLEG